MAARALVDAEDSEILDRLRLIAPSAHWRNTWLLAAGLVHRNRGYLFDRVLHTLREIDADTFGLVYKTGPRLAVALLDDGMASTSPKHLRTLVAHALEVLQGTCLGPAELGEVLATVGGQAYVRDEVREAIARAWHGSPSEHHSAIAVLDAIAAKEHSGPLHAWARQIRSRPRRFPDASEPAIGVTVRLSDALPASARDWPRRTPRGAFLADLRTIQTTVGEDGAFRVPGGAIHARESAIMALGNDEDILEISRAVADIDPANWPARSAITALLLRAQERLPVSPLLMPRTAPS